MNRNRFFMTGGPVGPISTTPGFYSRPANPWVHTQVQKVIGTQRPQVASITLAGQESACCSGCAHDKRQGH